MTTNDRQRFAHARRKSRRLAMQALYQWQMTGQTPNEIFQQFTVDQDLHGADPEYFRELLFQIEELRESLDAALLPDLERDDMDGVDPVERAILRIAAYELVHRPEIPFRVVMNEAIELTKKFGAELSHKYVNGVLDKAVRRLRARELSIKH